MVWVVLVVESLLVAAIWLSAASCRKREVEFEVWRSLPILAMTAFMLAIGIFAALVWVWNLVL